MSISRSAFLAAAVLSSLMTTALRADDLAATVAGKLRDSGAMKGYRVNVKAKAGTVWLEGTVSDPKQIEAAVAAAESVDGVERVVNRLSTGIKAPSQSSDRFALPHSVRSLVGLPTEAPAAAAGQAEAATDAGVAEQEEEIQLTQAVAPTARTARPSPRPLNPQVSRPMQAAPRAASGQRMAMRTSAMRQMDMPVAGGYSEGMVGEQIVNGGGVADGQMVPGSMRMIEGPSSQAVCPPGQAGMPGGMAGGGMPGGGMGGPMPMGAMGPGGPGGPGMAVPVRGDGPNMPNYAWPSYAAYPNYAALQYPTQYSPTAWPYIGPFYPYPQVPLGWRRVSLEWDDGWWWLDFDERHVHSHHR
jgi:hypothetical protein